MQVSVQWLDIQLDFKHRGALAHRASKFQVVLQSVTASNTMFKPNRNISISKSV